MKKTEQAQNRRRRRRAFEFAVHAVFLLLGLITVGFVLLINLGGMLPLLAELRKRRREYRQLLQEEPPD